MAIDYTAEVRKIKSRVRRYSRSQERYLDNYISYQNSFEIQRVAEDTKFFGQVIIQRLNLKMRNYTIQPFSTDDRWTIQLYDTGTTDFEEHFPWFYTSEVHTNENTNEKSITAYDRLSLIEDYTVADLNLTPPYTIEQFANKIAKVRGFSANYCKFINIESDLLSLSYSEGANLEDTDKLLDCLSWIAEVLGAICYVDSTNYITFKRLDKDGAAAHTISKADYISLSSGDSKRLGKIIYATELGDNLEAHTIESGSTQAVRNNAFLDNRYDRADLIQQQLEDLGGLTIGTFDMQWRGNPNIQLGDKIEIERKDGTFQTTFLLDETLTFNGALSSKLRYYWDQNKESDDDANPTTIGEAVYQTFAKVDKVNKRIDLVASDVQTNTEHISGVTNDLTAIDSRVTTNESKIGSLEVTTENITGTVSNISSRTENLETTTTNLDSRVTTAQNTANTAKTNAATADGKAVAAQNTANGVRTDLTTTQQQVQTNKEDIAQLVIDKEGITQRVSNTETSITNITTTTIPAIQQEVDNIEVGGRNLATKTATPVTTQPTGSNSWGNPTHLFPTSTYGMGLLADTTNTQFTIQFDWAATGFDTATTGYISLLQTSSSSYGGVGVSFTIPVGESSGSVKHTFTPTAAQRTYGTGWLVSGFGTDNRNATITISNLKFEIGNKATTWTVAPEDVEGDITTAQNTADGVRADLTTTQTQVETNRQNIGTLTTTSTEITGRVSSLETTTTTINTTIGTIQSDINNLAVGGRNLFIAATRTNNVYITNTGTVATWQKTITSDYIEVAEGDNIIVQCWKPENTAATGDNRGYVSYALWNSEKGFVSRNYIYFTADYQKQTFTIPTGTAYIRITYHFGMDGDSGVDWNPYGDFQVKVEKGTLPTEWSIAPEDIDTSITTTNSRITTTNQNVSELSTTVNGISGTVSSIQTTVNTNTGAIGDLQTYVDQLDVGGRNLLIDTNAPSLTKVAAGGNRYFSDSQVTHTTVSYKEFADAPLNIQYGGEWAVSATGSNGRALAFYNGALVPLVDGESYTFSCYARITSGEKVRMRIFVGVTTYPIIATKDISNTEWKKISITFTYNATAIGDTSGTGARFYVGNVGTYLGTIQMCGFKLEQGTLATEYTPAPEDVDYKVYVAQNTADTATENVTNVTSRVTTLEQTTNGINATVSSHTSSISTLTTNVGTAQSNITALQTALNNLGTRNYIINTLNPSVLTQDSRPRMINQPTPSYQGGTVEVAEHGIRTINTAAQRTYYQMGSNSTLNGLEAGETYTLSFDASWKQLSGTIDNDNTYYMTAYLLSDKTTQGTIVNTAYKAFGTITKAKRGTEMNGRCEFTFTIPENATMFYFWIGCGSTSAAMYAAGDYMELRNLQLEKGTTASDWNAAPEDYEKAINEAETALSGDIKNTQSAVEGVTGDINEITGNLDNVKNDLKNTTETLTTKVNELEKQVNLRMTDEAVELAIDEKLNNGVKSVETETGYRFDKDGLTISKSDSNLATQIDNTGMTVSNSFEDVLTATNNGVDAVNLTARNYLIVGTRLLIQDFGSGSVGFYYIGD